MRRLLSSAIVGCVFIALGISAFAQPGPDVLKDEFQRVATIAKVRPSVVSIFGQGGQGGGTGVLISDDGFALTNFHVVEGSGPTMKCGLPDGVLYDAVLVGLDKVGDVALIKLYPQKEGMKFPHATLGDSDTVREGDWSLAMGNPFLLATDFNPTVTFGLVSGVHRYQYPSGAILEYTDCIQVEASINPGNSGGPLFDMKGELIGINGRGSFDKRGRVNSGVGYAISINQIKNFLGHLHAGLDADHASLGALITTQTEKSGLARMVVTSILEESDAARRGLDLEDELLSFAGRTITSVNHYKNVLGLYPRGWRMPLEYRREQARKEILVRLMGAQRRVISEGPEPKDGPPPMPNGPMPKGPPSPLVKYYEPKTGFANAYFNRVERDRLWASFKKHGDFTALAGNWSFSGNIRFKKSNTDTVARIEINDEKDGTSTKTLVKMMIGEFPYVLEPLKSGSEAASLRTPDGSGGLLAAMFLYKQFLLRGEKGFGSEFTHGGYEPFYPPRIDGKAPTSLASLRVDAEVINSRLGPYLAKWFFSRDDGKLLGFEMRFEENEDPCEIYLGDYRPENGRLVPHRLQVVYGNSNYGTLVFDRVALAAN